MVNRLRGEVEAVLDGRARTLCLTLGALAELEAALGVEDLGALAERFGKGRLRAREAIAVIGAGLRGGGGHGLGRRGGGDARRRRRGRLRPARRRAAGGDLRRGCGRMSGGSAVARLAGLAVAALRLPPRDVWAMTPREVALALRALAPEPAGPPGQDELRALMARFPDDREERDGPLR